MQPSDLLLALLLPLPPWIGFLVYRARGRVGLSYGYFLGGILGLFTMPWPQATGAPVPVSELGGALFGFSLFLQAHREGRQGLRRLLLGVGGTSLFALLLGARLGAPMMPLWVFWSSALIMGSLWLGLADIGFRATHGKALHLRMPVMGALAMTTGTLLTHVLPLKILPLPWAASLLSGFLLGLVALHQLLYLREHGIWVEGRGEGFRVALSTLEREQPPEAPALGVVLDTQQPVLLVNHRGMLLECNSAFGRLVGLMRHQLRGYDLQAFFQGRDVAVWKDLEEQLLRQGHGETMAALVRKDGSFESVQLEATAFDRNLALVWVASPSAGSLALREDGSGTAILDDPELAHPGRKVAVNALGTIVPAAEQILAEAQAPRIREAAERILMAAQRLAPDTVGAHGLSTLPKTIAEAVPRLGRMLPREIRMGVRSEALSLRAEPEALRRVLTHLVLHGRQSLEQGQVILQATGRELGGRPWGLLSMALEGRVTERPTDLMGLGWLLQSVRACHGILDLHRDERGQVWPQVWLPGAEPPQPGPEAPLAGLRIWVLDQDPLVLGSLEAIAGQAGATADTFGDLRDLLRASRRLPMPDLLVMERTSRLERFRRILHNLQLTPVPMLLLGTGSTLLQADPIAFAHSRVAFLEKPFTGSDFVQCLLALTSPEAERTPS